MGGGREELKRERMFLGDFPPRFLSFSQNNELFCLCLLLFGGERRGEERRGEERKLRKELKRAKKKERKKK